MNKSPIVKTTFQNNNVQNSTPLLGVSGVVAVTTKGAYNDPSVLIKNYSQFTELFGTEVVPDGSVSNIKRALDLGSILRVSRVKPKGVETPYATAYNLETHAADQAIASIIFEEGSGSDAKQFKFKVRVKHGNSSIIDPASPSANAPFYVSLVKGDNDPTAYSLFVHASAASMTGSKVTIEDVITKHLIFTQSTTRKFNDFSPFYQFNENSETVIFELVGSSVPDVMDVESFVSYTQRNQSSLFSLKLGAEGSESATAQDNIFLTLKEGAQTGPAVAADWYTAFDALREYIDYYTVMLSHVEQHIADEASVYSLVAPAVDADQEYMLFTELGKINSDGSPLSPEDLETQAQSQASALMASPFCAMFGGGVKFSGPKGMTNNDLLGTAIGVFNKVSSSYGPYYSIAGFNRGLLNDCQGPVIRNLGTPNLYDQLNQLALACVNLVVIKDTRNAGRRSMLWHQFTLEQKQNSDRFISSIMLKIFLKKNIRPIIESYIEEPNYVDTWKNIYFEVKDILDNLLGVSFSEYEWVGDQFANSYADMVLNKESDVRNGMYKALLRYRDIVTLQIVELGIQVDASTKTITIS